MLFAHVSAEKLHVCELLTCSVSGLHVVTDTCRNWSCSVLVRCAALKSSEHVLTRRRFALTHLDLIGSSILGQINIIIKKKKKKHTI